MDIKKIQQVKTPTISVYSGKRYDYPELQLFKKQVDEEQLGPFHQPYTAKKKSVMTYRTVFYVLASFYLALGLTLYFKQLSWSFSFLFGGISLAVKPLICSFCGLASTSTLLLGLTMRTEREAAKSLYKRGKERLKLAYERKMAQFGLRRYLAFGEEYRKTVALHQIYHDTLEKLHEYCDDTIHMLERISKSQLDTTKRERLFNQALLEMDDRQNFVIDTFKGITPPQLTSHK